MNFHLKLDTPNNSISAINVKHINLQSIPKKNNLLFKKYYKIVSAEKEKIDSLENSDSWDRMKKIGNPYELIYTTYNKKKRNDSISNYTPISRSYFKMWEIFYNFDIFQYFDINNNFIFSHLAEGPGGFMEASYNYKRLKSNSLNNKFYGITLKPTTEYIPDFTKIKKIFNNNENVNIDYGNLYNIDDVRDYIKKFKTHKAHFVTADGGFDYSSDFNGQEINSCQIIYSECIVALNVLRKHGSFVCKVFDLFSITMVQILYLMYNAFEDIYIYKPETSRPANSEKYLICMYYKDNLDNSSKRHLLNIIEEWNESKLNEDDSILFQNIKVDNAFVQKLSQYNEKYLESQMFYLNKTIELAKSEITKESYHEIIQEQVTNAITWCNKYNVEINKNSTFYKKNTQSI